MNKKISYIAATFFYMGQVPFAPGTFTSFAAALIAIILSSNIFLYVGFTLIAIYVGFAVCDDAEKQIGTKDPSAIVIDEVAGVMISFFMLPLSWPVIITAFFLFRAFDMFKIYPVNKFEELPGAKGIMWDDLIAGLYTNIIMHLAIRFTTLA